MDEVAVFKELLRETNRLIMVIGSADSGKTTFVEKAAGLLSAGFKTGVVDLDMGQSHIGPPTTLAWGAVSGRWEGWSKIRTEDFYFTGALSPAGNLLPAVAGARLMVDRALKACDKAIIDTTGLISEPAGRVLKQYKIDLLMPDLIVALEQGQELGPILDPLRLHKKPAIYRLPVSEKAASKSAVRRAQYRLERLKEYFRDSRMVKAAFGKVPMRFTREPAYSSMAGRLAAFVNSKGEHMALGRVEGRYGGYIAIRTPLKRNREFASILIGTAIVEI